MCNSVILTSVGVPGGYEYCSLDMYILSVVVSGTEYTCRHCTLIFRAAGLQ